MIELKGKEGELRFSVSIKRKDTGKVENYELVGKITEDKQNASNTFNDSEKRSD